MFLFTIGPSRSDLARYELPKSNLVIDPRLIERSPHSIRLKFHLVIEDEGGNDLNWSGSGTDTSASTTTDNGSAITDKRTTPNRTLIVKRTDETDPRTNAGRRGWGYKVTFRAYHKSTENVPDFLSPTYTYLGVKDEVAPIETIIGKVHPSVRTIRAGAFRGCVNMVRCSMTDNVTTIEESVFHGCKNVKVIKLSRSLRWIGKGAFCSCQSIDGIFIPLSVQSIGDFAFMSCEKMRILSLPAALDLDKVGQRIVAYCNRMMLHDNDNKYHRIDYEYGRHCHRDKRGGKRGGGRNLNIVTNNDEVNQWLKHRLDHLPFFQLCHDPAITTERIYDYINDKGKKEALQRDEHGLTSLHILVTNPHANSGAIVACLDAHPNAAFAKDDRGLTPFDILWKNCECKYECDYNTYIENNFDRRQLPIDIMADAVQALCRHWNEHTFGAKI